MGCSLGSNYALPSKHDLEQWILIFVLKPAANSRCALLRTKSFFMAIHFTRSRDYWPYLPVAQYIELQLLFCLSHMRPSIHGTIYSLSFMVDAKKMTAIPIAIAKPAIFSCFFFIFLSRCTCFSFGAILESKDFRSVQSFNLDPIPKTFSSPVVPNFSSPS
jgi:hypothetical protein